MQVRCCFLQQVSVCDAVPAHLISAWQLADTATALIRYRYFPFESNWMRIWERFFYPVYESFFDPVEKSIFADIVRDNSAKLKQCLVHETGWKPESVAREIISLREVLRDQTNPIKWSAQYPGEYVYLWEDLPTRAQHRALICICKHFHLPYQVVLYVEYVESDEECDEEADT
jgi:hypothetical protein